MSWKEEYKKRRNVKLYFKDKLVDVLPVSEINEEAKNRVRPFLTEAKTLTFRVELEFFIKNPFTGKVLLKEGKNHAENFVSTINKIAGIKNINLKAHFLPSIDSKKVEAIGRIEAEDFKDLVKEVSDFNRLLLDYESINFCHRFTYQLFSDSKKIFCVSYISKDFPLSLKGEFKLKQPYKEAYSLKDMPKIIEHYKLIGDIIANYCKNYGVSVKCLRPKNWFPFLKKISTSLIKDEEWQKLDEELELEESVTLRNWPSFYGKKPIKIEKKEEIKELNQRLLAFEIIRNSHPLGFELLSEASVHQTPIDAIRDIDPLSLEYQDTLKIVNKILEFDKSIGLKDIIVRASGSSVGGYHLFIPLIYEENLISPSSQLKLETYERRKSPGEILLDSLRETILTYSLISTLKSKLKVGFDPRNFSEKIESDAIVDTTSICFNKGWKVPGSLNSKIRHGVCCYVEKPFETSWDYLYFTSMHYVHENLEKMEEPKVSDKVRRENFKVLKDFIKENRGSEIVLEYDRRKRYEAYSELLNHLRKLV
ncbi:MAG: hypothetical protein QXS48_02930 [Candidatus Aenigmatarchaeota archaeon]